MTTLHNSPAALALRAELAHARQTLPALFKNFDPVLKLLDAWVDQSTVLEELLERRMGYLEARLAGLDRMPAAHSLDLLNGAAGE